MSGRFRTLFSQDLTLAARNLFVIVGLIILAIGVVVYYALPDDLDREAATYFHDARAAGSAASASSQPREANTGLSGRLGVDSKAIFETRQELETRVAEEDGAIGIVLEAEGHVTVVSAGPLTEERRALIQAGLSQAFRGPSASYAVEQLQPDAPRLGVDDLLIPVLVAFDVLILGFLFVAVMLFQEKQEGTIWAYRVTPGGTFAYVTAKVGLWVVLSVIYGVLLAAATVGFGMTVTAWAQYLAVLVLSSLFMTSLGLFVAVFFEGISDWFFVGIVILVINMVPNVSFMNPSFSPAWVTEIPSYSAIFTVRDILFGTGREGFFGEFLIRYAAYNAVAIPLAFAAVGRRLMKEARS